MGHIFAFMTATVTRHGESDSGDDYTAVSGWIDRNWSMTDLLESRNDVTPLISEDENSENLADYVRDVLGDGSLYEDNGDGTFIGQTETTDDDGRSWTYAVHFKRKYKGNDGPLDWCETSWHPMDDGGISLTV